MTEGVRKKKRMCSNHTPPKEFYANILRDGNGEFYCCPWCKEDIREKEESSEEKEEEACCTYN